MVSKAGKKKRPSSVDTDTDIFTEDDGEPSLWIMMAAMGPMLATLTTRIEHLEKNKGTQDNPATSHMVTQL